MKLSLVCILICLSVTSVFSQKKQPVQDSASYPFKFDSKIFGDVKVNKKPKIDSTDESVKQHWPIDAPAHQCYQLDVDHPLPAVEKGARYFWPAYTFVCIVPTSDPSEKDFAKAYPNFSKAIDKIKILLKNKPKEFRQFEDLFDFPYNSSGWSIEARKEYLNYANVSGVFFLTQYSQDMTPTPLNNEELTANFQGLTKDGKFYVAARFGVTHASLPRGIDFVDNKAQEKCLEIKYPEINDCVRAYLRLEDNKLETLPETGFKPSLSSIRSLLASVSP